MTWELFIYLYLAVGIAMAVFAHYVWTVRNPPKNLSSGEINVATFFAFVFWWILLIVIVFKASKGKKK